MNINTAFPSKYLKTGDLQGRRATLTVDYVEAQTIGNDQRLVVFFAGKQKGLVLNKTNAVMIQEIAGTDETDNWRGVKIVIYPAKVDFQGRRVDAIRVDWPADAQRPAAGNTFNGNGDGLDF